MNNLPTPSKEEWAAIGASLAIGGALLAITTKSTIWFSIGCLAGASTIWYGVYLDKKGKLMRPPVRANKPLIKEGEDDMLGAPIIRPVEVPRVGSPKPIKDSGELDGYPVSFRVPLTEVDIDTMDDRIRPHYTGPLGPENDPVRYW